MLLIENTHRKQTNVQKKDYHMKYCNDENSNAANVLYENEVLLQACIKRFKSEKPLHIPVTALQQYIHVKLFRNTETKPVTLVICG